jgi:predicted TIM-barrel fold metal-dependent hydrolase
VVAVSVSIVDSDEHLYEPRSLWVDHIDPGRRADALALVDDELGYTWLEWRGQRLELADVHLPGDVDSCGRHRERRRRGQPPSYRYDDALPDAYWDPTARVGWLDAVGLEGAVCFPNFGLLWERRLSGSLPALTTNMGAWNRWCASVATDGGGRLHPVAHLTLRDPTWLEAQLAELSARGVRLAMVAPAPVEGRPLSHPDHDRVWSAFVHHGVSPVFHVADQPRVFDDCWYTDPDSFVPTIESIFLWVPAALGLADLIVNGVLERHPELRIGVVELSSIWVPQFLLMLDGATEFTSRLNGRPPAALRLRPSEYFLRHVRVSSFAYEDPRRLTTRSGDLFMCCSDYPHSEGTATLLTDYATAGCDPMSYPGLYHDNVEFLLGPS